MDNLITQEKIGKYNCPYCNHEHDSVTGKSGDLPKVDDISVCIECAEISLFTKELTLRKATDQEIGELMKSEEIWNSITKFRNGIIIIKKEKL